MHISVLDLAQVFVPVLRNQKHQTVLAVESEPLWHTQLNLFVLCERNEDGSAEIQGFTAAEKVGQAVSHSHTSFIHTQLRTHAAIFFILFFLTPSKCELWFAVHTQRLGVADSNALWPPNTRLPSRTPTMSISQRHRVQQLACDLHTKRYIMAADRLALQTLSRGADQSPAQRKLLLLIQQSGDTSQMFYY